MSLAFKGRHFAPDIILLCMRWYCRYALRYRDIEEMMAERGLLVDHTTIDRWVQQLCARTRPTRPVVQGSQQRQLVRR